MKGTIAVAAAAALAGGVSAASLHHRHMHNELFEKRDNATCTPGCTTIWTTYYGEATLVSPPSPPTSSAPVVVETTSTATFSPTPAPTSNSPVVVPTPVAQTCPTPGVYTFPATTVTLTETTTVCAASTTSVPSGTHTLGGVTTVVSTETTVTCPYATYSTNPVGQTTSVIETTTYVCPSAGTYTIAPHTTTVASPTTVVVPVISTYCPGTYTQPEVVTTIVDTSTVIYCPFDVPTTSSAPVAVTTAPAPVVSVYPTTTPVVVPASSSYPASSAAATPSSGAGNGGTLGGTGDKWAITYTPYTNTGVCKDASDVTSDIETIKNAGFTTIRVYSTDCDTLPNVGAACEAHGIKMILGVYIDSPSCSASHPTVQEQISAISSWAKWDMVELISVGNEAMSAGHCTASELASLISTCKSEFSGYTGPYTTADTLNIWEESEVSSALCSVIDKVGCNAHAFFNTETVASEAGTFVAGQLELVNNICPGKAGVILETGWPSAGNCMGKACPGVTEQEEAIASIKSAVGKDVVFFSFIDDDWKSPNTECACEQYWGCGKLFGA